MKNTVKKILRESLLDEAAFNINHLPEDVALFSGNQGINLILFDPKTNQVYATIAAALRTQDGYDVDSVAAEKGFGPFIYELAMMQANQKGKGIMPNRRGDIREKALNVWMKFYDRNDVLKQPIEPFLANGEINPLYRVDVLTGDDYEFEDHADFMDYYNGLSDSDKKVLSVFNTIYSMKPDSQYQTLLNRGKTYNPNVAKKAVSAGNKFFFDKYD